MVKTSKNPASVCVLVKISVKTGFSSEVTELFRQSRKRCLLMDNCEAFDITIDNSRENGLLIVEVWHSIEDHKQEVASIMAADGFPHFRKMLTDDLSFSYYPILH